MKKTVLVIGSGVIGLACARELVIKGFDVLIVEKQSMVGSDTSSRNSGVIHAGIYYTQNSLKAKLCVEGKKLLYEFCQKNDIKFKRCEKLIVSNGERQSKALVDLQKRAADNSVETIFITGAEAQHLEPELSAHGALLSKSTGIIDVQNYMDVLSREIANFDGLFALNTEIRKIKPDSNAVVVKGISCGDEFEENFDFVINSAGHGAYALAKKYMSNLPDIHPKFAKGDYFSLSGKPPFSRLIYPMPNEHGLGIHFTLDFDGGCKFGPDVDWVDDFSYLVDSNKEVLFRERIQEYWPTIVDRKLLPDYAGIRPKLKMNDFFIQYENNVVTLLGIESPGLTASLSIARNVSAKIIGEATH